MIVPVPFSLFVGLLAFFLVGVLGVFARQQELTAVALAEREASARKATTPAIDWASAIREAQLASADDDEPAATAAQEETNDD